MFRGLMDNASFGSDENCPKVTRKTSSDVMLTILKRCDLLSKIVSGFSCANNKTQTQIVVTGLAAFSSVTNIPFTSYCKD